MKSSKQWTGRGIDFQKMADNLSVDDVIMQIKADLDIYKPAYGNLISELQAEVEKIRPDLVFRQDKLSAEITVEAGYHKFFNNFYNRLPGAEAFIGRPSLTKIYGIEEVIGKLNSNGLLNKSVAEIETYLRTDEARDLGLNLPLDFCKEVLMPIYVELRFQGYTRDSLIS